MLGNLLGLLCIGALVFWFLPALAFMLVSMYRGKWDLDDVRGVVLWKDERQSVPYNVRGKPDIPDWLEEEMNPKWNPHPAWKDE